MSLNEKLNYFVTKVRVAKGSSKPKASSYPKSNNAISSVGCLRQCLANEGISERASYLHNFIASSRKEGTHSTYSAACHKWVSCYAEQIIDPVEYDVNWILEFLTSLFESGDECGKICT